MLAVVVIAALVPGLLTHYDPVKLLLQDKFLPPSPSTGSAPTTSGATSIPEWSTAAVTLLSTLMVLVLAAGIGTIAGALAGFYGGWIDTR